MLEACFGHVDLTGITHRNLEKLEGIILKKPCQLCKSNEKNKNFCTKVDYVLLGHKLSWATAQFVRCKAKWKHSIAPDEASSRPQKLVP